MKGLTLRHGKWSRNIFRIIFKDIDYSQWALDVFFWESYGNTTMRVDFNEMEEIPSELAKQELLEKDNEIYPEFMKVLIRSCDSIKAEIKTYEEFLLSPYFLSIIIIDHRIIEICGKDEDILVQIRDNFMNSNLENVRIHELINIPLSAVLDPWRQRDETNIYDKTK
ncbi:MAG: DUF2691 family protein [Candidatus Izemoplasmatales bacterium]|jgi:hypothetical protein|nr:DUF2691 family protein [Candidatus Izemoplasmatales bacterium]